MDYKKIIFPVFIFVVLVQIFVPAKMIFDSEKVLGLGKEFRFKIAPIDPNDPFRGKYITLRYDENKTCVQSEGDWTRHGTVYVNLTTDHEGYAKIHSVSKLEPSDNHDYVKAKVRYVSSDSSNTLTIGYPFSRYYMEESKAAGAEIAYRESLRDTIKETYALVNVKDGEAVLRDVLIDGVSIKEIVKNRKENED